MQASSINLLAVALTLLCLAPSLYSDPQRSPWTNYDGNPVDPRSHLVRNVQEFSEGYHGSPRPRRYPVQVTRDNYEARNFERPPGLLDYPEGIAGTRSTDEYLNPVARINRSESKRKEENSGEENREKDRSEESVREKMRVLDKLLSEESDDLDANGIKDSIIPEESRRVVRQVRKARPGFFWTLARVTFETINDTRSAIKQISDIIGNNIAPDTATQSTVNSESLTAVNATSAGKSNATRVNATETTTSSPTTTTAAPFVITRSLLQSLIRRNVLGLVKLFNIEWNDALNQSDVTVKEFQRHLGNQVGVYLQDNPNAF